jgi:hypothetical protein
MYENCSTFQLQATLDYPGSGGGRKITHKPQNHVKAKALKTWHKNEFNEKLFRKNDEVT